LPPLILWIIAAGFLLKAPVFGAPLIGHFGSYQIVNAMMARAMDFKDLESWLAPRTSMLMDGHPALHLIYYPFGSLAAAVLNILPGSLDFWGRFQAAAFMALSSLLFWRLIKPYLSDRESIFSITLFVFSPLCLIYGIALQNEAAALFFQLAAFSLILKPGLTAAFFGGILFSLSLLARLHFVFLLPVFLLPLFCFFKDFRRPLLFVSGVILPAGLWFAYTWVLQQSRGDEIMTSLFMQAGEGRILSLDVLFSAEFLQRFLKGVCLWVTPIMIPIALGGAWVGRFRNPVRLALLSVFCSASTAVLLPQKVMDHSFYLMAGVPGMCVLAGAGLELLLSRKGRVWAAAILGVFFLMTIRYYKGPAAESFSSHARHLQSVGWTVESLTQEGDLIAAQSGTSPELLYYTGRRGWPFNMEMAPGDLTLQNRHQVLKSQGYGYPERWLEHLIRQGADYLVISDLPGLSKLTGFETYLSSRYKFSEYPENKFRIYDLKESLS